MTVSMDLLVIKHTGHVVAGMTRVAGGPGLDPATMVGPALPVRNIREENQNLQAFAAWLPASVLEVKSAPLDPRVLASPQDYVIDGGAAVRIATDAPTTTVKGLQSDKIVIDRAAGEAKLKVFALVAAQDDQQGTVRVQAGAFPDPLAADVDLPLTVLPDDTAASLSTATACGIMVAVAGKRLHWAKATVP